MGSICDLHAPPDGCCARWRIRDHAVGENRNDNGIRTVVHVDRDLRRTWLRLGKPGAHQSMGPNPIPRSSIMRRAAYAGSFDPITLGHLWMIEQGRALFDELVVAIGINPDKRFLFSLDDRLAMLRESVTDFANVRI